MIKVSKYDTNFQKGVGKMKIKSKTVSLLWKTPVSEDMPFYEAFIEYWERCDSCQNLCGYLLFLDFRYDSYLKAVKKGGWTDSFEEYVEAQR